MAPKGEPKKKKQKTAKAKKKEEDEEDEEDDEEEFEPGNDEDDDDDDAGDEDADEDQNAVVKRNDDGEAYFEFSGNRRMTVRKFKGNIMVDLREYYDKSGKAMPGKKGISLPVAQFNAVAEIIKSGAVDREIASLEKN